ncbi:MAG: hypothetical protein HUU29_01910 [Planctomycetaceae bacterium]|nr:hypothetical protein [Planctomycetaceae bacterium]
MAHESNEAMRELLRLHRTLRLRWAIRTGVISLAVALAVVVMVLAVLHASPLQAFASIGICVIVLSLVVRRLQRPDVRDAALFAERYGEESGAVELLLTDTPTAHVDALKTLHTVRSERFAPLLRLRDVFGLVLLTGILAALATTSHNDQSPTLSMNGNDQASHAAGTPPALRGVLDEFRRSVFSASEDQRREAAKAYAALWDQRGTAIDELRAAGQAGLEAASGAENGTNTVAERQVAAVNAARATGLDVGDAEVKAQPTPNELREQSSTILKTAADLAEANAVAEALLSRTLVSPDTSTDNVMAGRGEGGVRPVGTLDTLGGGRISIAPGVWQADNVPSKEGATRVPPIVAAAMDRYAKVFDEE